MAQADSIRDKRMREQLTSPAKAYGLIMVLTLLVACSEFKEPLEILTDDADYISHAQDYLEQAILVKHTRDQNLEQIGYVSLALETGQWRVTWKPDEIADNEFLFMEYPAGVKARVPIDEVPKRLIRGYRIVEVIVRKGTVLGAYTAPRGVLGVFKVYQDGVVTPCLTFVAHHWDFLEIDHIMVFANYEVPPGRDFIC